MSFQNDVIMKKILGSFQEVLYKDDTTFMENMKTRNLAGDDVNKYRFWEWTQGVGLYAIWKLFKETGDESYLNILTKYYDRQLSIGLPSKNINTVAPMLTLAHLYEYTKNPIYYEPCVEWARWIMDELPRTKEGGFQHITSDTLNDQELWDDTLFMTVLFLAKMGVILVEKSYIDEVEYQFLLHCKYLEDKKSGLWYHGWTFNGNHNFVNAFWGRGNCWITMAIPELFDMVPISKSVERILKHTIEKQIMTLEEYQDESGMWHTLIDDSSSYLEASATCGFAYGILKAVQMGLVDEYYVKCTRKALEAIVNLVDDSGVVNQVSYGTPMGRDTKEFYKKIPIQPMPYGQALALLFLNEQTKWDADDEK